MFLLLLVAKLGLATQLYEKLHFGASETQFLEHVRSQVQLGNEA